MTDAQLEYHECNLDVAYQEMDRRQAQGEDMSEYTVCPLTYDIVKAR